MEKQKKYFAFISYSSHDQVWGERLQRKLEHYRMPATLCSERGWKRRPMDPVFFAPTDIQPGGLTAELQERLRSSQHLIVICSPHSAQSEWVGMEIEYFHSLGRTKNIHLFIVDGKPNSGDPETECFNPVFQRLGLPEILGANIHEPIFRSARLNRERAYVQLISKLLDVEFDSIWQRHRRQMAQKALAWTFGTLLVAAALATVWKTNQPFDATVRLQEASVHNDYLPPLQDAVVTLSLDNETKIDTLRTPDAATVFSNIPHRFLNREVRVTVDCRYFLPVDTVMLLQRDMAVAIRRDPQPFGDIRFSLWDPERGCTFPGAEVEIAGRRATADASGCIQLSIPLAEQRQGYRVTCTNPVASDTVTMPCSPDQVAIVKSGTVK